MRMPAWFYEVDREHKKRAALIMGTNIAIVILLAVGLVAMHFGMHPPFLVYAVLIGLLIVNTANLIHVIRWGV